MTRGVRKDTGKSANWKGGKTVTSRGYVLVWVGKDHPLADVRGYAYEHRLVAAQLWHAGIVQPSSGGAGKSVLDKVAQKLGVTRSAKSGKGHF
jgi:hypothetical protein